MWISRFRLTNFSSFFDSDFIELSPGFNLFIGPNNSGKSALLRSLSNPLPNNPHKNEKAFRGSDLAVPSVQIDLNTTPTEIVRVFSRIGQDAFFPVENSSDSGVDRLLSFLRENENIILELQWSQGQNPQPRGNGSISALRNKDGYTSAHIGSINGGLRAHGTRGGPDSLGNMLTEPFGTVFHFDAQRLNVARSSFDTPHRLFSNARNLPAVLAHLQGARRPVFDIIEDHVIRILGGIQRITVAPKGSDFEILIWPDRESIFEELSFSLNDSGTGVGQLLSILTAVVTSEQSIIIIDEVNSFLHPTAVKKLLLLLRSDYPQHQYIISTHSADAISSCSAEKLYIVEREGFESRVREVSLSDADQAREVAGHLGFSMMDVFGLDRIIWVEGPTEEICFQYLIRAFGMDDGLDIGFAPVGSPSGFTNERRDQALVDIYDRAGKRLSPLLKGMAFALDREKLSDEEVEKQERSKRKLKLLPRRCLECFLLEPNAIANVLTELDSRQHHVEAVRGAIINLGPEVRLGASTHWNGAIENVEWLKRVDGARLISRLFDQLTDNRVEYRKTRDGISILRYIAEKTPEYLDELLKYLEKVIEICLRDSKP